MSDEPIKTNEASPEPKKVKVAVERSAYGHKLTSPSGFIDMCLITGGMSEKQMLAAVSDNFKKKFSIGTIRGHIKHLLLTGAVMKVFKGTDGSIQHEILEAPKIEQKVRAKKEAAPANAVEAPANAEENATPTSGQEAAPQQS